MPTEDNTTAARLTRAVLAVCGEHSVASLQSSLPVITAQLGDDLTGHFDEVTAAALRLARLREEAARREQGLAALRELTASLLHGAPTDTVLEALTVQARGLVGADTATVALPDGDDTLVLRVADGAYADRLRGTAFPREPSVSGEVIRSGEAIVLEDAATDPRASQPVVQLGHFGPTMFVPLVARAKPFGTLLVSNLSGGAPFTEADLHLVEAFAAQASVVVDYGRAREETERLALLEERDRLGRELQESVIRRLFSLGLELERLAGGLAGDGNSAAAALPRLVDELDDVIRQVRASLYPST
jgi:GAF domain-containing protein